MDIPEALERFRVSVCLQAEEADPNESLDWFDMSYGFFLALQLSPKDARRAAVEARYTHQYWMKS